MPRKDDELNEQLDDLSSDQLRTMGKCCLECCRRVRQCQSITDGLPAKLMLTFDTWLCFDTISRAFCP